MGNTLITASAGSGKTTKLVSTLLELLKEHKAASLVAITFTNAAASEIKQRVAVPELNVGTIHSFFSGILREQAIHLNLNPNFKICDEIDAELIFSLLCKDFLLKQATKEDYYELFVEYGFKGLVEIMQKLESRFSTVSKNLELKQNDFLCREQLAEKDRVQFLLKKYDVVKNLQLLSSVSARKDEDSLERDRQQIAGYSIRLIELIRAEKYEDLVRLISGLDFLKKPGNKGSKANWGDEFLIKDVKLAISKIVDLVKEIIEQVFFAGMPEVASRFEYKLMMLFREVHDLYISVKRQKELLDFNDIENLTYDLVMSNPEICKKYSDRYECVLVDEFQDTNRLQKDVLQKLSKNLFLVGDAKQSIYRFRNADVSVFIETEKLLENQSSKLSNNYRSFTNIVGFVNQTFCEIFDSWLDDKKEFDACHQEMYSKREGEGIVSVVNVGTEDLSVDEEAAGAARYSVELIIQGLARGRKPSDYAILFRTGKFLSLFEEELKFAGIKCNLVETDFELNRSLIRFFRFLLNPYDELSLFEVTKYPAFFISDASLYKLKNDKDGFWNILQKYDLLLNELDLPAEDLSSISRLKDFVKRAFQIKDSSRFQVFVSFVMKESLFLETMYMRKDGDIGEIETLLFDAAVRVDETGGGIAEFLEILRVAGASRNFNPAAEGVRLMSVHASKGLQFPVVIIPCMHQPKPIIDALVANSEGVFSLKLRDEHEISKYNSTALYRTLKEYELAAERAEARRLLYVAMTRAMDELYLVSRFQKDVDLESAKKDLKWNKWISAVHADRIVDVEIPPARIDCVGTIGKMRVDQKFFTDRKINVCSAAQRYTVSELKEDLPLSDGEHKFSGVEMLGIFVHRALELYDKKDPKPFEDFLKNLGGDTQKIVGDIVNKFLNSSVGKSVFTDEQIEYVLKEESFLHKYNDKLIRGRIDRINVYKDHVLIIDYKTGIDDNVMDSHRAQLEYYRFFGEAYFKGKKVITKIIDVLDCTEHS